MVLPETDVATKHVTILMNLAILIAIIAHQDIQVLVLADIHPQKAKYVLAELQVVRSATNAVLVLHQVLHQVRLLALHPVHLQAVQEDQLLQIHGVMFTKIAAVWFVGPVDTNNIAGICTKQAMLRFILAITIAKIQAPVKRNLFVA